jgi:2,4-dienoyl-CoA reductase (NADPH2)
MVEFLSHSGNGSDPTRSYQDFAREWGIDLELQARGGVEGIEACPQQPEREIWLLQRSAGKPGAHLGKTTGWIHRLNLKRHGIRALSGVRYLKIDDRGLHIEHGGQAMVLEVDNVVICAGQLENRDLADALEARGLTAHVIGGARVAGELDAKRAIREGSELAARI